MNNSPKTARRNPRSGAPRPRRRSLRVVSSPDASSIGRELLLTGPTIEIGREVTGEGRVADDCLSARHLRVARSAASALEQIEDLDSSNGTYVNGRRLRRPEVASAAPGTVIVAGDTILVVDQEPDPHLLPSRPDADERAAAEVLGASHAARGLRRAIDTVAKEADPVLLLGPTGVGKEVAASAIHRLSGRRGPWVPVNCAAIPASIAEAELFGIAEGAATETRARDGYFVQASGGTLFLDEVGDLAPALQAKILRVLQDGVVQPVGGAPRKVDVRIIAATNADLEATGFRKDLRARLASVWELHLAPLKDRRADVFILWQHFLSRSDPARARQRATPELVEALLLYDWPENVRTLAGLARKLAVLVPADEVLDLEHLPEALQERILNRDDDSHLDAPLGPEGTLAPRRIAKERLEQALTQQHGNISEVARELGLLHREQVYRLCRRHGFDPESYR